MSAEVKKASSLAFDKNAAASILGKFGCDDRYTKRSLATLTFDELFSQLTPNESAVIKQLLALKPHELGFLGPFVSNEPPPGNLVPIEGQKYMRDGKEIVFADQFLPGAVWQAFQKMQATIKEDIGSDLLVESGYRSPAHQAITFLTYLERFNFDVNYVARGVALPGFSQHGDPWHTAIDVINQNGIPTDEEPEFFAETKEYNWLIKNAGRFNFLLSYPEGNKFGVKFEPWHWRYLTSQVLGSSY